MIAVTPYTVDTMDVYQVCWCAAAMVLMDVGEPPASTTEKVARSECSLFVRKRYLATASRTRRFPASKPAATGMPSIREHVIRALRLLVRMGIEIRA